MFKVTIPAEVNTKTFPAAVAEGTVKFYRVRENGTTRNVPVLKGEDLELAQAIKAAREEGVSVRDIAKANHISVATVRRYLQELELTEKVAGLNRSGIIRVFADRTL
jgi:DNA invertase Pin-like site-specific DNA recombinase